MKAPVPTRRTRDRRAKLTALQVKEIRAHLSEGRLSTREIGLRYGVDESTIGRIRQGRNWNERGSIARQAYRKVVARGVKHGSAKLNDAKVRAILSSLSQGIRGASLARKFGVCEAIITRIKQRKIWRHVSTSLARMDKFPP